MRNKELHDCLIGHNFTITENVNTNNGWGFGGAVKDVYDRDNIIVNTGIAFYRHLPRTKFITISVDCKKVFDEIDNKVNTKKAIDYINSIIQMTL